MQDIAKTDDGFRLKLNGVTTLCASLIVATGGKSIPKMGATGFGYEVAQQFGVPVVPTRPALVPLTFEIGLLERLKPLAGVSVAARIASGKTRFEEAMLFTHRGISGPAVLQVSSYWREGGEIEVDMAPGVDIFAGEVTAENGRGGGGEDGRGVLDFSRRVVERHQMRQLGCQLDAHGGAAAMQVGAELAGATDALGGGDNLAVGVEFPGGYFVKTQLMQHGDNSI